MESTLELLEGRNDPEVVDGDLLILASSSSASTKGWTWGEMVEKATVDDDVAGVAVEEEEELYGARDSSILFPECIFYFFVCLRCSKIILLKDSLRIYR